MRLLPFDAVHIRSTVGAAPGARQRGIVADFLRRPRKLDNRALEYLFVHAWNQLAAGQYAACDRSLKAANWILGLLGG